MKSSVYEVRGCAGSRVQVEVEALLNAKEARIRASQHNRDRADGRGVSYQQHFRERAFSEGWRFGARSGRDGYRLEAQYR